MAVSRASAGQPGRVAAAEAGVMAQEIRFARRQGFGCLEGILSGRREKEVEVGELHALIVSQKDLTGFENLSGLDKIIV